MEKVTAPKLKLCLKIRKQLESLTLLVNKGSDELSHEPYYILSNLGWEIRKEKKKKADNQLTWSHHGGCGTSWDALTVGLSHCWTFCPRQGCLLGDIVVGLFMYTMHITYK